MEIERTDGRTPHQLRPLGCSRSSLNRAHGSATWSQGDTKVIAAVYGPKAGTKKNENPEKASIEVIWKPKTGQTASKSSRLYDICYSLRSIISLISVPISSKLIGTSPPTEATRREAKLPTFNPPTQQKSDHPNNKPTSTPPLPQPPLATLNPIKPYPTPPSKAEQPKFTPATTTIEPIYHYPTNPPKCPSANPPPLSAPEAHNPQISLPPMRHLNLPPPQWQQRVEKRWVVQRVCDSSPLVNQREFSGGQRWSLLVWCYSNHRLFCQLLQNISNPVEEVSICCSLTETGEVILDPTKLEEQTMKAFVYLVFPNSISSALPQVSLDTNDEPMEHGIITSVTHGVMSVENYFRCLERGRAATAKLSNFLRNRLQSAPQ
ncbi:hypothetical protein KSS87_022944 [Heliosperma pusillum]|nr:hypothetical protein KSS87_022944 [Heliosperma pusillum]